MKIIKQYILTSLLLVLAINFNSCSNSTLVNYGTNYYAPCWSADGTKIYYFRNDLTVLDVIRGAPMGNQTYKYERSEWFMCSCDVDGNDSKGIIKVGEFKGINGYGAMDVSSSGEIIYWFFLERDNGIWVIKNNGTGNHQLLSWGMYPRWAFNYTKIIFEGNGSYAGIWMMDKDGKNLTQILTEGSSPVFCDTNQKMIYHKNGWIWIYSFIDSSNDSIVEGTWGDWLHDGSKFVYRSEKGSTLFDMLDSSSGKWYGVYGWYGAPRLSISAKIVIGDAGNIKLMNIDGSDFKVLIKDNMDHIYD